MATLRVLALFSFAVTVVCACRTVTCQPVVSVVKTDAGPTNHFVELNKKVDVLTNLVFALYNASSVEGLPANVWLIKQKKTFDDAEALCQLFGGHLASFATLDEAELIRTSLHEKRKKEGWDQDIWLGGRGVTTATGNAATMNFTDGTPWPDDFCATDICGSPWLASYPMTREKGFGENDCLDAFIAEGTETGSYREWVCYALFWPLCRI